MVREQRGRIAAAIVLIVLGLYFLAVQFIPGFRGLALNESNWYLLLVGLGAIFLVAALLTWTPGLMIPAAVLGGLGALFFWQSQTDNWNSWAYAWTLIPGFVGVGVLLMYLMQGNVRDALLRGGVLILISFAAFLVLAFFPNAVELLGQYWAVLLIAGGVLLLARAFLRRA